MGKLIITENQYNKLKDLIIESEITKSFLMEQDFKIDNKSGDVTITNDFKFEVVLQHGGYGNYTISKGSILKPTEKGNVGGEVFIDTHGGNSYQRDKIYFLCKSNQLMRGSDKVSVDAKVISEICKSAEIKKNLSKGFGAEAVGGGSGYTQKYDQNVKNDKGEVIKIPKNTGYVSKNGGTGASFRVGNQYGWFDCKAKNFIINKVRYANSVLADHIGKSLCQGTVTPTPSVGGGGSPSVGGSKVGGWKPNAQTLTDIEMYI